MDDQRYYGIGNPQALHQSSDIIVGLKPGMSLTAQEFLEAMDWAKEYGLKNIDPRSLRIRDFYTRSGYPQRPDNFLGICVELTMHYI